MTTGPARATPDLVLSVPDPDISLHFLMQCLKMRESSSEETSINASPAALSDRLSGRISQAK
jgi:hypothetical protein